MSLFGLLNQNSGQYVMGDSAFAGSDEPNDVTSLSVPNQCQLGQDRFRAAFAHAPR